MLTLLRRLVLSSLLLAAVGARAQQNVPGIDINIHSGINPAEQKKRMADPAYGKDPKRARVFFLARVSEERTGEHLVRPVDAAALARQVTHQLELQGFRPVLPGQHPDIIVTVKYGRGVLSNPYTITDDDKQYSSLSDSAGIQAWPTHEKFVGLNERAARMRYEKLIVQVRAWEYPPPRDPKKKEKLLWMTTMFVDDPDHRDLNLIADQMLAKGGPYFDRHIGKEDEVIINTVTPQGHVDVGPVEVVKDPKAK